MSVLRWILVAPASLAGWLIALALGLALYRIADHFCPPELVISGLCTAPWHRPVIDVVTVACASLSAVLVVLLPVLVAPGHRSTVAVTAFVLGAGYAGYLVHGDVHGGAVVLVSGIAAILSGGVVAWRVWRNHDQSARA